MGGMANKSLLVFCLMVLAIASFVLVSAAGFSTAQTSATASTAEPLIPVWLIVALPVSIGLFVIFVLVQLRRLKKQRERTKNA
jgi:TRAP-type C4-dicarboxylate transport system permease small subunit